MANKIINVLIVDDEQIVREGLRYIIDWNTLGFCICGEAANGEDALEMNPPVPPRGLVSRVCRMSGMFGTGTNGEKAPHRFFAVTCFTPTFKLSIAISFINIFILFIIASFLYTSSLVPTITSFFKILKPITNKGSLYDIPIPFLA